MKNIAVEMGHVYPAMFHRQGLIYYYVSRLKTNQLTDDDRKLEVLTGYGGSVSKSKDLASLPQHQ